ncbi:haloacid dehalogenase, type II [Kwoniella sp. DSM 27419]
METCKALVFDCYGTLIDWEQGSWDALQPLVTQKTCPEPERLFAALGAIKARIQAEDHTMIYPAVLKEAYRLLTGEFRLWYDEEAAQAFAESVGSWPAFPDSQEALATLNGAGVKLFILSNVDNDSFAETRKKLEGDWGSFDGVFTAEDLGSYKPDFRNFHHVLQNLDAEYDIQPGEVLFVANSKRADIEPAGRLGLKTVWINRPGAILGVKGYEHVKPTYTFESMERFADALREVKEEDE